MPREKDALTPQQQRFVEEYLKDLNASQAYQRAGYKVTGIVAEVNASRLLRLAKVKAAVNEAKLKRAKRAEVSADRVLQESARLAFLDIRQLYEDDGTLKPVSQWPAEVAAAVASIESVQQYADVGGKKIPVGIAKKIRLWDKPGALTLLAKHLKLLQEEPAQNIVNVQINVRTSLAEALADAYNTRPSTPENGNRPLASGSEPV